MTQSSPAATGRPANPSAHYIRARSHTLNTSQRTPGASSPHTITNMENYQKMEKIGEGRLPFARPLRPVPACLAQLD